MYHDRSELNYERIFIENQKKPKRSLSPKSVRSSPVAKKVRKNKLVPAEYVIESIIDVTYMYGKEFFLIKWLGFSHSENTWEPIEHLDNCPEVLISFVSNKEIEYCEKFEGLKEEISFDNLTSDESLVQRLHEIDDNTDVANLKVKLLLKLLCILTLSASEEHAAATLIQETRNTLQLYVLARRRYRQLIALKKWEDHLNQIDKSKKIVVENLVDLAGPPENFTYIHQSIPGQGVVIPDDPPIGCKCDNCNCRSNCCCGLQGETYAYTTKKRLRIAPGMPIYECNKACKCPPECTNRVVQAGRKFKLCIFRTSNGRGWGVRSEQKIYQGQFLCQYVGEVITNEEAEKRGREYDANGLTYLFDLDFNSVENVYTIDAAFSGNISHFINHSCDPNLGVWAVWADCLDPNLPMLALFALRNIEAGEEICFDYLQKAGDVNNDNLSSISGIIGMQALTNAATVAEKIKSPSPTNDRIRTECKCGALKCRKYLF